jgi:hypothetical protein
MRVRWRGKAPIEPLLIMDSSFSATLVDLPRIAVVVSLGSIKDPASRLLRDRPNPTPPRRR